MDIAALRQQHRDARVPPARRRGAGLGIRLTTMNMLMWHFSLAPMLALALLLLAIATCARTADNAKPLKSLGHAVLAGAGLVKSASHHDKDVGDIEASVFAPPAFISYDVPYFAL